MSVVQHVDTSGNGGVSLITIKQLRVLDYADDAAMVEHEEEQMTSRLTTFTDQLELIRVDMHEVKLSKTFSQIVQHQESVDGATLSEIKKHTHKM